MLPSTKSRPLSVPQTFYPEEEPAEGEWYSRAVVQIKPQYSRKTVFLAGSVAAASLLMSGGAVALACKDKKLQIESFCVAGVFLLIAVGAIWRAFQALRQHHEKQPLL